MHLGAVFMTVGWVATIPGPWNPQGASRRTPVHAPVQVIPPSGEQEEDTSLMITQGASNM